MHLLELQNDHLLVMEAHLQSGGKPIAIVSQLKKDETD